MRNPYRYFKTSPAIIQLAVMMYVRYPLSLRQVEDLLHERGIDVSYEAIRFWWNRFGSMVAKKLRQRQQRLYQGPDNWRWHLDEVFVKINGETYYLWRAVDHEGTVLDALVTRKRNRHAALNEKATEMLPSSRGYCHRSPWILSSHTSQTWHRQSTGRGATYQQSG